MRQCFLLRRTCTVNRRSDAYIVRMRIKRNPIGQAIYRPVPFLAPSNELFILFGDVLLTGNYFNCNKKTSHSDQSVLNIQ